MLQEAVCANQCCGVPTNEIIGLAAARLLRKEGVEVIVLEARDRVGGRTYTVQSYQKSELHRWQSLFVPRRFDAAERYVTVPNADVFVICDMSAVGEHFGYLDIGGAYIGGTQDHVLRVLREVGLADKLYCVYYENKCVFTILGRRYVTRDGDFPTFWNPFVNMDTNNFFRKLDQMGEEFFIAINVTSEAYEASLLWFLWYVKQCGGVKRIISVKNGGQ
ncbi:hypothetical protein HPB47_016864, partial [Ixodes persulcatus]